MKKIKIFLIAIFTPFIFVVILSDENIFAAPNLAEKLAGKILLQVEEHGEAWYVNSIDLKKYYLGRPADAFELMKKMGVGITNNDLKKIPIGLLAIGEQDDDGDGLDNALENSIGTDPTKIDSDEDGYADKLEIENNYDPLGKEKPEIDKSFTEKNKGKIFLQVENAGQAWYVEPSGLKRYFLNRPTNAFSIMKKLGLGITNENINQIPVGYLDQTETQTSNNNQTNETFYSAASAIMSGNNSEVLSYFTPEMQTAIDYTLNFLDNEGKFSLGNIMAGAKLSSSSESEKIYSTNISFAGYNKTLNFVVKKQPDEKWLLANL